MDLETRARLVAAFRVELKQTRRQLRRRHSGQASAYATEQAMAPQHDAYPVLRPRFVDSAPNSDPDLEARISRRIANSRRGRAVRNVPLTRVIDRPNPERPDFDRAHTGIVPRPSRSVGDRIRQTVARDAPARQSVIYHGLTADQILAREGRIRSVQRRDAQRSRRFDRLMQGMNGGQVSREHNPRDPIEAARRRAARHRTP